MIRPFALALAALACPCLAGAQDTLVLCGDPYPPYTLGSPQQESPTGGLAVNYVQELFKRVGGVQLKLVLRPFKRCLVEVEDGSVDGVFLVGKHPGRSDWMAYTRQPYWTASMVLYYAKQRFPQGLAVHQLDDLTHYHVGVLRGASYGTGFDAMEAQGRVAVDESSDEQSLFRKLLFGRIDLVPMNALGGKALVLKQGLSDQVEHIDAPPSFGSPYYLGLSRKSRALELLPRIDAAMETMQQQGVTAGIFNARAIHDALGR
jgi:polar amino acid transport system substrate-binding protein